MEVPTATADDEKLAAALLPVLLHRINNTTQLVMAVRSLFELGAGEMPTRCSADLADAAAAAHEQGWLLGVIAGGVGADLLLERHERDALGSVLRLVRDGLRRTGRDLVWDAERAPSLNAPRAADEPAAWRTCWLIAGTVFAAGARLPHGGRLTLEFELDGDACVLRGDSGADEGWLAFASERCARVSPQASCARAQTSWSLRLPREWAEPAREAGRLR